MFRWKRCYPYLPPPYHAYGQIFNGDVTVFLLFLGYFLHGITWRPEELNAAQPLHDPLVQCTLWPRITELPDVQKKLDSAQPLLDPLVNVQCTLWPRITDLTSRRTARCTASPVLCDPGLLNYLTSRRTGLRPASAWPTRTQPASQRRPGPCTSSCRKPVPVVLSFFVYHGLKPRIDLRLEDWLSFASTVFLSSPKTMVKKLRPTLIFSKVSTWSVS